MCNQNVLYFGFIFQFNFYGKIDNVPYKNTNQAFSNFYLKPCLVNQYYLLTLTQKQH